VLNLLINRW